MNQQIQFGAIEKSDFQNILNQYKDSNKVIVVDENTHDLWLEYFITNFEDLADAEIILLPVGEENKVMEVCFQVWNALIEYQISKNDLLINIGGGVVTDMGAFIASIYKRGMNFINIPTTLLGMVDASIGGKNGIDVGQYKNMLGTINFPLLTIVDKQFLASLDESELWNGYAEMLKHALIKNRDLWFELALKENMEDLIDIDLIEKTAKVKIDIIEQDPFEKDSRKLLNFGHTIGHAIEGFYLEKGEKIGHGHAVALGMLYEVKYAKLIGKLSVNEFEQIEQVLKRFPKVEIDSEEIEMLIEIMMNDKKNAQQQIKGILIKGIGECETDFTFEIEHLKEVLSH